MQSGPGGGGDTTTTTQRLPPWMEQYARGTLDFAKQVANQPYQKYPGQLVAGFTPTQRDYFQAIRDQMGVAGGNIQNFANTLNPLTKFTPEQVQAGQLAKTDLSPYMNPYTQNVVNTSLAALDRQT